MLYRLPKIRLCIPEDVAAETNNPVTVPLTLEPDAGGVLGPDHDVLDRTTFRQLRDGLGAYIVTNAPALVRQALRVPAGEPGIL
jgi:hypothetical protein